MTVLLAGGAGYIGSHTAVQLLMSGHDVVIADDYSNSCPEVINRIEEITGKQVRAYETDVKDKVKVQRIFAENEIDCVIHFAGLKAVGESVQQPLKYYRNNIDTTLTLLECMQEAGVKQFVFSSSATVYGEENAIPYIETMKRGSCSNPYGWTKVMMEEILEDAAKADPELTVVLLRYFNPIGAHESGRIGEDPQGIPNNLMPYITQVAVGKLKELGVFGNDYDTPDGTGVRDYIHVVDLAKGHVKAMKKLEAKEGVSIYNLGTGVGYSVLDVLHAYEKACGKTLKYEIQPRRDGDIATCYSDCTKAKEELGWVAEKGIEEMCADSWRWQSMNPNGYRD